MGDTCPVGQIGLLPLVTGEQQNLPLFALFQQPLQCGSHAGVVEIGQGIVQNEGDLFLCGEDGSANGQSGGQVQLIGCALAQKTYVAARVISGGRSRQGKSTVEKYLRVLLAGQCAENFGGATSQLGREPGLHDQVGPI